MPQTLVTQGNFSFVVTHNKVNASSCVLANIVQYGGTGIPVLRVGSITQGNFTVTLSNPSDSALSGQVKIAYTIL